MKFKCEICGRYFKGLSGLGIHVSRAPDHPDLNTYYKEFGIERKKLRNYMRDFIKSRVKIEGDCWIWQKYCDINNYPFMNGNYFYPKEMAHRVSYKVFVGQIPKKFKVVQRCNHRNCLNPKHLQLEKSRKNGGIKSAQKCIINDVEYDSMTKAAKALGVANSTIICRINKNQENYKLLEEGEN